MAKAKLSIPHERRKLALKSAIMQSRVKVAEHRERIARARDELSAFTPKRPKPEEI